MVSIRNKDILIPETELTVPIPELIFPDGLLGLK